jgi:hypothetical protein
MEYPEYTDKEKAFLFHCMNFSESNDDVPTTFLEYNTFFRLTQKYKKEIEILSTLVDKININFMGTFDNYQEYCDNLDEQILSYLSANNTNPELNNPDTQDNEVYQYLTEENEDSFGTYTIK